MGKALSAMGMGVWTEVRTAWEDSLRVRSHHYPFTEGCLWPGRQIHADQINLANL